MVRSYASHSSNRCGFSVTEIKAFSRLEFSLYLVKSLSQNKKSSQRTILRPMLHRHNARAKRGIYTFG